MKRKDGENNKIDLKGGIVLDGLPSSAGLVNAIASECLIRSTGTDLIAFLDSPDFPAISVITNYLPQYPVRIYVNESLKVAFFVSDINIDRPLQRDVANAILKWTKENECKLIISAQGVPSPSIPTSSHGIDRRNENPSHGDDTASSKSNISDNSESGTGSLPPAYGYAATSTESAAKLVIGHTNYFSHLRSGTIGGIPAILLNEGALTNLDVIVFLINVLPDVPDFRAAAIISQAVSKIIPNLSCDIGALMVEAQLIEDRMKNVRDEHKRTYYIA